MRKWIIGLFIFLFLALTLFSLILGNKAKELAKKKQSVHTSSTVTPVPSLTQKSSSH